MLGNEKQNHPNQVDEQKFSNQNTTALKPKQDLQVTGKGQPWWALAYQWSGYSQANPKLGCGFLPWEGVKLQLRPYGQSPWQKDKGDVPKSSKPSCS